MQPNNSDKIFYVNGIKVIINNIGVKIFAKTSYHSSIIFKYLVEEGFLDEVGSYELTSE